MKYHVELKSNRQLSQRAMTALVVITHFLKYVFVMYIAVCCYLCVLRYIEWRVGVPVTGLTLPNVCTCTMLGFGFPNVICCGLFLCSAIASSINMKSDCSF